MTEVVPHGGNFSVERNLTMRNAAFLSSDLGAAPWP